MAQRLEAHSLHSSTSWATEVPDSLDKLQEGAEQDRIRLTQAMQQYTLSDIVATQSHQSLTNTDDYTDADEFIVNRLSMGSTEDEQAFPQPVMGVFKGNSPDSVGGSAASLNRHSMISDYSPSLHEANPVAYFVQRDQSPTKPMAVRISRANSQRSHAQKDSTSSTASLRYPIQSQSASSTHLVIPEDRKPSVDSFDFDVGPLNTQREGRAVSVERQEFTTVDPVIPSRSPRRPFSVLGVPSQRGIDHRRTRSHEPGSNLNLPEPVEGVVQPLDEVVSNAELVDADATVDAETTVETIETTEKAPRPLPPPPVPEHRIVSKADDGFITEDEDKAKVKPKKKKKKQHKFNHETLLQMLQVTEGTIVGQEFQNIGLEPLDKQLIERLVDSLSRLTSDMIMDPERHEESVKRLNKAIKSLEGF